MRLQTITMIILVTLLVMIYRDGEAGSVVFGFANDNCTEQAIPARVRVWDYPNGVETLKCEEVTATEFRCDNLTAEYPKVEIIYFPRVEGVE